MAVSRLLGFLKFESCTIRSADSENPSLEPNMEWIGRTVCEIFVFKLYFDLETGFRGHSRSSKAALFDRAHTNLYSCSIVNMFLSIAICESRILVENRYLSHVFGAPVRGETVTFTKQPLVTKTRIVGLSESERILTIRSAVLIQSTRVTDRRTDRWNYAVHGIYAHI